MTKIISFFFYKIIFYLNKFIFFITKKDLLIWFDEFLQTDSYKKITILGKDIKFFTPNNITNWRVDSFFTKEPETLKWIDTFSKKKNIIFWDIGSNIGLFSIYNALKNKNSQTISFEPSTSNLRILSRNISINDIKNINIMPIPLTNKKNKFLIMKESQFTYGGGLNSYGEKYNFEGKIYISNMNYKLFGTTINYLLEQKILKIPDYIKIDVDGIEHLILEGCGKYLSDKKIKSVSIEINENFTNQYKKILNIMKKNKFKILQKENNKNFFKIEKKFKKTFNYIFIK
jgi:FkbM family methyltransferase